MNLHLRGARIKGFGWVKAGCDIPGDTLNPSPKLFTTAFPPFALCPQTAYGIDDMPSVVRYPRGTGYGVEKLNSLFGYELKEMPRKGEDLPIGKGRIVRRPRATAGQKAVILSIGTRLSSALEAAIQIEVSFERAVGSIGVFVGTFVYNFRR